MSRPFAFPAGSSETARGHNPDHIPSNLVGNADSSSGVGTNNSLMMHQAPMYSSSSLSMSMPADGWSSMSLAMIPNLNSLAAPDATAADVDSDVLDSSSASGDDSDDNDGGSSRGGGAEHDEEVYMEFIRSVFAADNDLESRSLCSAGTDEDDEEYRPESSGRGRTDAADAGGTSRSEADGADGSSSDEEELDEGQFAQISKHELQELVGSSWRTVTCPSSPQPSKPSSATSGYHQASVGDHNSLDLFMGGPAHAHEDPGREKNSMSSVLDKLFAGCKVSDICVDGIQVDSLRRLVARQMSMALQLLVQMLMLCDERSRCENECFKHIMEISNCRSASLRKSALMRQQLKVVHQFQKGLSSSSGLSSLAMSGGGHHGSSAAAGRAYHSGLTSGDASSDLSDSAASGNDDSSSDSDSEGGYRHLTRSKALRMGQHAALANAGKVTPNSKSSDKDKLKSSSVFDIPMLADVNALLLAIDGARKLKRSIPRLGLPNVEQSASDMPPPITKSAQLQHQQLLGILEQQVKEVEGKFDSRIWNCLIPRSDYPLSPDFVAGRISDTSSLFNRALFTPAEDDLLLRGLIMWSQSPNASSSSSDAMWDTIQEKLLPSKERQLLEFRYSQLIHSDEPEGERFRKYLKLLKDRKRNIRNWTLEEDTDLLKGFQVFGSDKWHMINLYFLPHRPRRELKNRWAYLLKEWAKKLSTQKKRGRQDGSVNMGVVQFLHSLRTRGAQAEDPQDNAFVGSHAHINTIGMMSTSQGLQHPSDPSTGGFNPTSAGRALWATHQAPGVAYGSVPGTSIPRVRSGSFDIDPRGRVGAGIALGDEVEEDELLDSDGDDDDGGEADYGNQGRLRVPLVISQEQNLITESRPPLHSSSRNNGGMASASVAVSSPVRRTQDTRNMPRNNEIFPKSSASNNNQARPLPGDSSFRQGMSINSFLWDSSSAPGGVSGLSRMDAAVPAAAEDSSYADPNFTISDFLNFGQQPSETPGSVHSILDQNPFLMPSSLMGISRGQAAPVSPVRHGAANEPPAVPSPLRRSPRRHASTPLSPSTPSSKKRPIDASGADNPLHQQGTPMAPLYRASKAPRTDGSAEPTTPVRSSGMQAVSSPSSALLSPGGSDSRTTFFAKVLSLAKQQV